VTCGQKSVEQIGVLGKETEAEGGKGKGRAPGQGGDGRERDLWGAIWRSLGFRTGPKKRRGARTQKKEGGLILMVVGDKVTGSRTGKTRPYHRGQLYLERWEYPKSHLKI